MSSRFVGVHCVLWVWVCNSGCACTVQREVLNCVNRVEVIESEHCDTDVGLSAVKSACQSRNINKH